MKTKTISLILGLTLVSSVVQAQKSIPFRLTHENTIILKTMVNKKDSLHLMFQIAMEDAALSPVRTRNADHIVFNNQEISDGNTVTIANIDFQNVRFFDNERAGNEADGKIGTGIFKNKIFKIDYDNGQFVLYDTMPNLKGYQPISITLKEGGLYTTTESIMEGIPYALPFLLQSGYSGGLLYSNEFSDDKNLHEMLKVTNEKTLKNAAGQSLTTKQGILPSLKLGKTMLTNLTAGFFTGDLKMQRTNYMGADILKRFNWIFDAERKQAYIQPSKYFNDPYLSLK